MLMTPRKVDLYQNSRIWPVLYSLATYVPRDVFSFPSSCQFELKITSGWSQYSCVITAVLGAESKGSEVQNLPQLCGSSRPALLTISELDDGHGDTCL